MKLSTWKSYHFCLNSQTIDQPNVYLPGKIETNRNILRKKTRQPRRYALSFSKKVEFTHTLIITNNYQVHGCRRNFVRSSVPNDFPSLDLGRSTNTCLRKRKVSYLRTFLLIVRSLQKSILIVTNNSTVFGHRHKNFQPRYTIPEKWVI